MAVKSKVGRPPTVRNQILVALHEAKVATAVDLETNAAYLDSLVRSNFVRRAGTVKVIAGKGRPRVQFRLTDKGRGRARRLAAA